mgnify:CR=1
MCLVVNYDFYKLTGLLFDIKSKLIYVFYELTKIVAGRLHGNECFDLLDSVSGVSAALSLLPFRLPARL